jgi:hypothetical protein
MRVSELLEAHPQLLEVLIEASPAFAKLKNPLLRRTMSRLVTLAQAAQIGGLEPGALLERLNQALGLEATGEEASVGNESKLATPPPDWLASPVGFHLDVRPILAAACEVAAGQQEKRS